VVLKVTLLNVWNKTGISFIRRSSFLSGKLSRGRRSCPASIYKNPAVMMMTVMRMMMMTMMTLS